MKYVYWAALVVGAFLMLYAAVVGSLVLWLRVTTELPLACEPSGLIGFGCGGGSPTTRNGFLLEMTLILRAVIGLLLVEAFVGYRRRRTA